MYLHWLLLSSSLKVCYFSIGPVNTNSIFNFFFIVASPQWSIPNIPDIPAIPDPNGMMNFGNTTVPDMMGSIPSTPATNNLTEGVSGPITNGVMSMHNRVNKPRK